MQATFIVLSILIIIFIAFRYYAISKIKKTPLVKDNAKILTLTDSNFNFQIKDKIVLVDFWASWCAPCRMMAPILNDLSMELSDNAHVGKVNIEQYQSLAKRYKVRSIPTLILFKNGNEINRFIGVKSKEFLLQQIQKIK
jgi:thioredoxin 1